MFQVKLHIKTGFKIIIVTMFTIKTQILELGSHNKDRANKTDVQGGPYYLFISYLVHMTIIEYV